MKHYLMPFIMCSVFHAHAYAEEADQSQAAIKHLESASVAAQSGNSESAGQETELAKKHVIAHQAKHPLHPTSRNPDEIARRDHVKQALSKIGEAASLVKQGQVEYVSGATGDAIQQIQLETQSDQTVN